MITNNPSDLLKITKRNFVPVKLFIGNSFYIVEKDFFGIFRECIHSFTFKSASIKEKIHYEFNKMFVAKGKLLEISTSCIIGKDPSEDRTETLVHYEHKKIGDFHFSYTPDKSFTWGDYPNIKTSNWQIVFTADPPLKEKENTWSVDYYENLIKRYSDGDYPFFANWHLDDYAKDKEYTFDQLEKVKKTYWKCPVCDISSKEFLGEISFCEYPGFNQVYYWINRLWPEEDLPVLFSQIELTSSKNFLQTVEFRNKKVFERKIISNDDVKIISKEEYLRKKKSERLDKIWGRFKKVLSKPKLL